MEPFAVYAALQALMDTFAAKVHPALVCDDFAARVAAADSTRTAQLRVTAYPSSISGLSVPTQGLRPQ